jgi:hypothetical protein
MALVTITKDCEASENGIDIISFKEGQKVDVSEPLKKLLDDQGAIAKRGRKPKKTDEEE